MTCSDAPAPVAAVAGGAAAAESQWQLLTTRRFLPFFLTQFAGAFNDNVFRNALVILVTFGVAGDAASGAESGVLANIAAGLFILPFFLFSAFSGQLAEIGIMSVAAIGFWLNSVPLLLLCLFVLGMQVTLFGPLKFALLPQHLQDSEIVGGNALIDAGTFLAILLGTLAGGVLASIGAAGRNVTAVAVIALAVLGYLSSRSIPNAAPTDPQLRLHFNPFTETVRLVRYANGNRSVFLSILGISWFWLFGSLLLAQLPSYGHTVLHGAPSVVTLLLACFALGIGLGSLLCERLSGHKIEIGLVPLGSIGLTGFALDLYWARPAEIPGPVVSWLEFLQGVGGARIALDCALIGIFGGLFIVPLYALILKRSAITHRARIIACNNIMNAAFMVVAALLGVVWLRLGFSIPQLILLAAILNACVAIYIYTLVPEFLMRFLTWVLINILYRIRLRGLEHIPDEGAALLVCNHVSFMDPLIIGGSVRRPVRFVMDHQIFRIPILNFIFRTARAIPIAPAHENPQMLQDAFEQVDIELASGKVVCIFPEGKLTATGALNPFRSGVERILQRRPVPVVPLALRGLWGSFFSRQGGKAMQRLPRRFWSRIELVAAAAVPAERATAAELQAQVAALRGDLA